MNIEEKAKEYAKDCGICPTLESQDEIDNSHREEIERAYLAGYTQAVTDLSAENEKLREALSEIWSDIHFTNITKEEAMDRIGRLIQPNN